MDVRRITPNVAVSGQIQPADVATLADMGFKAIVCNRPDGEAADQPAFAEIEAAARAAGLAAAFIPVVPPAPTDENALAFRDAVTGFDKPVLAFCATGRRSASTWALAARDRLSTDEVIRMAATAGYDLEPLRERLDRSA
jgi:sulfide:quinone oxidoreductase